MTKWYNDPVQRARFKRDYRRETTNQENQRTFTYAGDYCRAAAVAIPQFGKTKEQEAYERQQALLPADQRDPEPPQWATDNYAIIISSKTINRDFHAEPSFDQQLWQALKTPEVFEIPPGHKLCVTCGDVRKVEKFGFDDRMLDGYRSSCYDCESARIAKLKREQRILEAEIRHSLGLPPKRPGRPRRTDNCVTVNV